ncbi:hypothetical protein BHE97_16255 [Aeromicrobium sp. PE09-221]|uniref:TetR/AcrR family transcriptional regulator n=1 Tax=Aeromicrobium sp. PE09-221 TaxID=1898043 RepID=UPI000B3EDE9D|nr:TetR/AcrR family transcriptional regulator [Aeromicrobium sp. PE09-221]OUZ07650.1 hypothetical protein BHE97_16255 [Aeromicrobium sp. PE09-221]
MSQKPTGDAPAVTTDWELKRQHILRCAAEVFLRRGYERGTTKEVAQLAGLSQPSIYHYVGSKADLLSALAEHAGRVLSDGLDEAIASTDEPVDRLKAIIRNFIMGQIENIGAWTLYWEEHHSIPAATALTMNTSKARFVHRIDDVVKQCQQCGALPDDTPSGILTEIMLGAIANIYRWYRNDGRYPDEQIVTGAYSLFGLTKVGTSDE